MAQNNLGTVPVQIASPSLTSGEVLFIQDLSSQSAYNASNVVKMNSNNGGSALQILRVNSAGNALEWATINLGSAYNTVQEEGVSLTQRTILNFVGDGITASDDGINSRTNITLDATLNSISNLGTAADKTIYTTGVDTWAETTLTAFGRSLIDDADAATARTTLGLGTIATQNANAVYITGGSITGIIDLAVADGGTGASDAATARANLGLVIGTDVQAHSANLDTWSTKTPPSGAVIGDTDTQSLSNKRIYPRKSTATSPTAITPDKSQFDEYYVTALANAITINNETTPSVGDTFVVYLTDNGTARSISFGTHYVGIGSVLPTTTTANKTMEIIIKYVTTTKALVSSSNQQ